MPGKEARFIGIKSFGYDPTTKALLIVYESGDAYRYTGITKEVYEDLLSAPSQERFIRDFIHDRYPQKRYPYMGMGEDV